MEITRRKQHQERILSKVEFDGEYAWMTGFPKVTVEQEEFEWQRKWLGIKGDAFYKLKYLGMLAEI